MMSRRRGERRFDDFSLLEAPERIRVAAGGAQAQNEASAHRDVDHDLRGLPEMQHDGVRRIRRRRQIGRRRRQSLGNSRQMTLNGHGTLGEHGPVENAHRGSASRTSSYPRSKTDALSHQKCAA